MWIINSTEVYLNLPERGNQEIWRKRRICIIQLVYQELNCVDV